MNGALLAAARDGARADIERLLAGGASASAVNENGQTPLILACAHGHAVCAALLLQHAAAASTLNHCDNIGRTALHHAAFKGRYECVEALLERVHAGKDADDVALDIDAQDETGQTALFKAAQSGHATVVLLLLTQAPRIFALDKVRVRHFPIVLSVKILRSMTASQTVDLSIFMFNFHFISIFHFRPVAALGGRRGRDGRHSARAARVVL